MVMMMRHGSELDALAPSTLRDSSELTQKD